MRDLYQRCDVGYLDQEKIVKAVYFVGIATQQDNVTTETCVRKNESSGTVVRFWGSGVEFPGRSRVSQVSSRSPCKKNRRPCCSSPSLTKVWAASATPTMKDEDNQQTRSFVIYWSLHFDVTEMLNESRVLRRTCDYDNGASSFRILISSYAEIRWYFVFNLVVNTTQG